MAATAEIIQFPNAALSAPKVVRREAPTHPWVYLLVDGRVGRCPVERFKMPEKMAACSAIKGSAMTERAVAVLPDIAAVLTRVVPWATVFVVPGLLRSGEGDFYSDRHEHFEIGGKQYARAGGTAYKAPTHDRDYIVLCGRSTAMGMTETAFHKAMHIVWRFLPDDAKRVLRAATDTGMAWLGNYYDHPEERACRLFASWCMAFAEGLPPVRFISDDLSVEGIFQWIASGQMADELILDDRVQVPDRAKAA